MALTEAEAAEILKAGESLKTAGGKAGDFAAALSTSASNLKTSSGAFSNVFTQGIGQVGTGVTNFAKSMANGAQGASAFSGIITSTVAGLSTMMGKFNVAGDVISKMAEFGEGYVVQALKQSDDLFTTFQGLSKVGGASVDGMQGVFDNIQKFGMTMNEMPQFGAMIAQNSEALAKLGGSVSQGTKTFANVAAGIQQSGLQAQFERMGLTIQAQNEGTANYLRLQTLTGASGKKSTEELTAGAAEYIRQQDRLSKLTGKSADTLAKEEEARMSDQRYRALSREMQQKADAAKAAGDIEGAKVIEAQMAANRELLANTPKELQKGVQDLMSGVVNSPEAQKMYTSMPQMAQTIMSQNFDASKVITAGAEEAKGALDRNTALAKAGLSNQVNADFAGLADLEAKNRVKTAEENAKFTKDEQDKLAKGSNVDINNQVALRDAQRQTTTAMDTLVQIGVGPLTEGMKNLATGLAGIVTVLPGAGEKTPLNREPTKKEAAQGITKEQLGRGEYAPATAGYESNLPDIKLKELTKAWSDFTDKAIFNLTTDTDKKATGKKEKTEEKEKPVKDSKGNIIPMKPLSSRATSPSAAPADARREIPRMQGLGDRGAGPAYQTPGILDVSRPENQPSTRSAAADSTTELATVFSEGFKALSRGQAEQTASVDELVELMRRSVGVQGKILQTSRA